jgi:hypothetical protein
VRQATSCILRAQVSEFSGDAMPASAEPLHPSLHLIEDHLDATVRTLELSLITRLLQARRHAEELRRRELRLKPLIALFVAGTAPLVDAAAELGDTTTRDFETGDTASAFLRSRGLIAPDAAGLERLSQLAVGEGYLVAERIRLGTLLDLVATFLDTLDVLYDLPGERAAGSLPAGVGSVVPAESGRAT